MAAATVKNGRHALLNIAKRLILAVLLFGAVCCRSSSRKAEVSADGTVHPAQSTRSGRVERNKAENTVTVHPKDGLHSATVVLMHGLDNSADGVVYLAEAWSTRMPHVKFILPSAPKRKVTLAGGMPMNAWYDIVGLDDRASESCDGIEASVERVKAILHQEHNLGLPYSRMLLAGFSQGGAMSLFTGLQLQLEIENEAAGAAPSLAGIMVMSAYLPGAGKFKLTEGFQHVPVLHLHGDADPVVQPKYAKQTQTILKKHGLEDYTLKWYRGVGHTISMEMVTDAGLFLQRTLPEDSAFAIKPKPPGEMSIKELKQAVRQLGLGAQAAGFYEKQEFVRLLEDHYSAGDE